MGAAHAPVTWRFGDAAGTLASRLGMLRVLLGSSKGRRQLLDALGSVMQAAMVDMDRAGRDPHATVAASPQLGGAEGLESGTGIQRFLPLAWSLACAQLSTLSADLGRPEEVVPGLCRERAACRLGSSEPVLTSGRYDWG